jgi:FkbM family methyltransferase
MARTNESLVDLLEPDRITTVVDIGANPIDGDPPYKSMLQKRLCRLIGFEPQIEALAALNAKKGDLETYLPYAVSDGEPARLRVCRAPGMTSLFEPDHNVLKHFQMFSEWGKVTREVPMTTRRLDDIDEIDAIDFLKVDIQGSELSVFKHGKLRLEEAVAVQTEVSFIAIYKNQPVFGDIDLELRKLGFIPHAFAAINKRMIAPMVGKTIYTAINQLFQADVVYVRDFTKPDETESEKLKHLAIVAHHCYQSYDLAMNCMYQLARRGVIRETVMSQYLNLVQSRAT